MSAAEIPEDVKSCPSYKILVALSQSFPGSVIKVGKTKLPVLVLPVKIIDDILVGPVRIFYNLTPKQFRIVDDSNKKYEHRCGTAQEVIDEVSSLYNEDFLPPVKEIANLR